jgi:hypothetical protein
MTHMTTNAYRFHNRFETWSATFDLRLAFLAKWTVVEGLDVAADSGVMLMTLVTANNLTGTRAP